MPATPAEAMGKSAGSVRFAVVGDIHMTKDAAGTLRGFFAQASTAADALLLCGDLTDYGTADEAKVLAEELGAVAVPIVAVLGNHDFESGTPQIVAETLIRAGVHVLDGEACEIEGVGIAGAKGFAGGFGRGSLGAWGEPAIKQFVQEALHEAMKLESALAKLRTPRRIALLHYSVDAVFHGHAHRGTLEGKTVNGVPVYNVSKPLLQRSRPDQPPFRLFELPRERDEEAAGAVPAAT